MENRNEERYLYYIFKSNAPVYLKEKSILDTVKNYPYFEINGNNQNSFFEPLKDFIYKNIGDEKSYIILNVENISKKNQKALTSLVKDKSYQTLSLSESYKIIVVGNEDKIAKELFGLLVVANV